MNFAYSPKVQELRERVQAFMDAHVYPAEKVFYQQVAEGDRWQPTAVVEELKAKAKAEGLWNLFLPESELGAGLTNTEYAPLAEIMGSSGLGPEAFNCSAPDTGNMEVLVRYGSEAQKREWLEPLLRGEIRSAFGMTEPGVASSDATNMEARAVREGDEWVINGRKWWTSGACDPRCKIMIFMGLVLIYGDLIERIGTISSINGLEYKLTTTIQKMIHKIGVLQNLPGKIDIKLFLSTSLQRVAPLMGLKNLDAMGGQIEIIVDRLNRKNYDRLRFESAAPAGEQEISSLAKKYNITPETLLWSNYDVLKDDPHLLTPGQVLQIPPTNGILYEWQEGDTLEIVARDFHASMDDILSWSGNNLDMTEPNIEPGDVMMIPGGEREFHQWVVPTYAVGKSGTNANLPGGCEVSGGGLWGSGFFIWPADNHYLSGNDFWSGHLAIDIATAMGAPIYAADSGVVVFAGWDSNGYGNVIMIDHQNGYHTLYAHLSTLYVSCGSSAYQGQVIGYAGSTGNSTGPHLHFEVRYLGGFLNPWTVLP